MVAQQTQRRDDVAPKSSATASPTAAAAPRQALRGLPFEEQEKLLTPGPEHGPGEAAPPQAQSEKPPTHSRAPAAADAEAPAAPAQEAAPAPATAVLTDAEVARAMTLARYTPLPPETMQALQTRLGMSNPSCILDRETVQAIAGFRLAETAAAEAAAVEAAALAAAEPTKSKSKSKPKPKRKPKVDKDLKAKLGVPDRDWIKKLGIEMVVGTQKFGKSSKGSEGGTPAEDAACMKHHKTDYNGYLKSLGTMEFLGSWITGHPELLKRLAQAERFLAARYPEAKDSNELAKRLGITRVGSLRVSSEKRSESNHGIGFAIDVNPGTNPWVFGNSGRSKQNEAIPKVLTRVAAFMGAGKRLTGAEIAKMAQTMSTTEIVAELGAVDAALEDYRKLGKLPKDALAEKIQERLSDSKVKEMGGAEFWALKIPFDDELMHKYIDDQGDKDDERKNQSRGFLDMDAVVIQALRDVAGLRWGGSDFGASENGDMMHFDGYGTIGTCTNLMSSIRSERKKAATTKSDAAAPKG